jgi:hypothetical protein
MAAPISSDQQQQIQALHEVASKIRDKEAKIDDVASLLLRNCDRLGIQVPQDRVLALAQNNLAKVPTATSAIALKALLQKCSKANYYKESRQLEDLHICHEYYTSLISNLPSKDEKAPEYDVQLQPKPLAPEECDKINTSHEKFKPRFEENAKNRDKTEFFKILNIIGSAVFGIGSGMMLVLGIPYVFLVPPVGVELVVAGSGCGALAILTGKKAYSLSKEQDELRVEEKKIQDDLARLKQITSATSSPHQRELLAKEITDSVLQREIFEALGINSSC